MAVVDTAVVDTAVVDTVAAATAVVGMAAVSHPVGAIVRRATRHPVTVPLVIVRRAIHLPLAIVLLTRSRGNC
jgi:hypothetical protein